MRLSGVQIRSLVKKTPQPISVYSVGNASIEIYRAKNAYDSSWEDPTLKTLVLFARQSYFRYGKRPLLDLYDNKSAIYLARASYPNESGELTEEWLSNRTVPGDDSPLGGGELEIYFYNGKSLDHCLQQKFFPNEEWDFWKYIVSNSRMCGIHPYTVQALGDSRRIGVKHRYTPLCLALIYVQFAIDYPLDVYPYVYTTSIIRDELRLRGLIVRRNSRIFRFAFTPAHKLLCLPNRKSIKLDRDTYAYQFPLYWLKRDKLLDVLSRLINQGRLTDVTIKYYTGATLQSKKGLQRIGRLLTASGMLYNSDLTGDELRAIINEDDVPEAPKVKITDIRAFNRSAIRMIEAMGIKILRRYPHLRHSM